MADVLVDRAGCRRVDSDPTVGRRVRRPDRLDEGHRFDVGGDGDRPPAPDGVPDPDADRRNVGAGAVNASPGHSSTPFIASGGGRSRPSANRS
ncbi:hypothetical protein BRC69_01530 [Halobacteriales archaeon QH_6_66_25]|nr:MAG: hypothetical protein BRC69_01530 [Halobacteriales archaeon QH_6_66_25]